MPSRAPTVDTALPSGTALSRFVTPTLTGLVATAAAVHAASIGELRPHLRCEAL